jgi:hypothetical protein
MHLIEYILSSYDTWENKGLLSAYWETRFTDFLGFAPVPREQNLYPSIRGTLLGHI